LLLLFCCIDIVHSQPANSEADSVGDYVLHQIVPLNRFVHIAPVAGGNSQKSAVALDKSELKDLVVGFARENLTDEEGPQFVKVTSTITTREGDIFDKTMQYAFTFARRINPDSDESTMRLYVQQILPFGFVSKRKIDSVDIQIDSLPDWSVLKIEVSPDEEYTKYSRRFATKCTWYYRAKGRRWETAFFLGIPKVLYDTRERDTLSYGNASAMLRFFLLDGETGSRFPVNVGVGTFGVSTPIDVSKQGGGFAVSFFFDLVQLLSNEFGLDLGSHFNGGLEATPFFPIAHRARLLLNARIGISP
jgi:hypothetical protein